MPLPTKRDYEDLRARLQTWLAGRLGPGHQPHVSEIRAPESTGMSSETLLFDASWGTETGRFVARMSPDMNDFPVFPEYDLELQFKCLEIVREKTSVPVPVARWYEPDPGHLGSAFLVMECIEGTAPPDLPPYTFGGWVMDATPQQREALQERSVAVLAQLHQISGDDPAVAFLDRPTFGPTALDQHLAYQRYYYDWAREGVSYPIIERTFDWLDDRKPEDDGPTVLNWGDSRIGNILYRDFTPVAVLDWEMASLGAREADLAWMLFMHEFFADLTQQMGMDGIPGFMDRHQLVSCYEHLTGHRVRNFEFYEVFAALRFAIVSIRTSGRAQEAGDMDGASDPDQKVMHRALIRRMLSGEHWS